MEPRVVNGIPQATDKLRVSKLTLLADVAAEAAWTYLVLHLLAALVSPGITFSPSVVVLPLVVPLLLVPWISRWRFAWDWMAGFIPDLPDKRGGLAARTFRAARFAAGAVAFAIAAMVYMISAAVTIFGAVWWDLFHSAIASTLWAEAPVLAAPPGDAITRVALLGCLGVFLWFRGTALAGNGVPARGLLPRALCGTGVIFGLLVLPPNDGLDQARTASVLGIYLAAALATLASARIDASGSWGRSSGMRPWLLALCVLAMAVGLAFSAWAIPWLSMPVRSAWDWANAVITPGLAWILWCISHLLGMDRPPQPLPVDPTVGSSERRGENQFFSLPDGVRDLGRLLFNLSWIVMILVAVFSTVARLVRARSGRSEAGALRQNLSWSLRLAIRQALFDLSIRLARRWQSLGRVLGLNSREGTSGAFLEMYIWLLVWASSRGCARAPSATPREHLATLSTTWPHLRTDFELVVESFLYARYGGGAQHRHDLQAVLAGWERISRDRTRPA